VPGSLQKVYYDATDSADASEFRKLFDAKTAKAEVVAGRKVEIWGRKLAVPESSADVAWFDFNSLCGKNLGAADYIEVTKAFDTIFVDAVPKMDLDTKDRVRLVPDVLQAPPYRPLTCVG
jgi:protein AFG1